MPSPRTKLGNLLEAVPDALVGVDRSGVIRLVNHQTETLFGYERQDLIGASIETLVPESVRQVHAAHRAGYDSNPKTRPMGSSLRLSGRRADGTQFPVDITLSPLNLGDRILAMAAVRDMSDRLRAESNRCQLDQLAAIVEHSDDAIISSTLDGVITCWNPAAEQLYGYTSQEIIGKSADLLSPNDQVGEIQSILGKIKAGEHVERHHTTGERKDGTPVRISLTASPIHDVSGAIIGASRIAHVLTREEETSEVFRSMIEASQDSMVSISPEGKITDANQATTRLTGHPRDELIGTDFSDYFTDPGKAKQSYQQALEYATVTAFPLTLRHRDGTLTDVTYNVCVYVDSNARVLGLFATARDLTDLNKAAQYARSLLEAALDPFVTISPEGKITDANQATIKATGVGRDELIGTDFSDYFTEPERANLGYQRVFEIGSVTDFPLTMRRQDGTLTEVLYNASLYRDAKGKVLGVFASARDVTKQIQAQKEAARQQARELNRLAELERFQRLTVGREIKMIELKKEIEYLRRSLPADRTNGGKSR